MRPLILALVFWVSPSILLTAQDKNPFCKSTLTLSAETVTTIFAAILDKSIFVLDTDSRYEVDPSICLEGAIESGVDDIPGMRLLMYAFLETKSKNKAIQKYNELLKEFKKCQPKYWYAMEKDFGQKQTIRWAGDDSESDGDPGVKYFMFTDKENYYTKQVTLMVEESGTGQYVVQIAFSCHFPDAEKYMEILKGLEDGSLRGAGLGDNRWKSNIILDGQIRSEIQSEDYGKNKGSASVVYWLLDEEKGREESLTLFNDIVQKIKEFKPARWSVNEYEGADHTLKQFGIAEFSEYHNYMVDVYWNDKNHVFITVQRIMDQLKKYYWSA
ncbi:MAG: hypothetical protein HOP10_00590 [Chitinophagaceae bacterium]|nr:hypothetical protein [Chitinophagaceae bacterium]